MPTTIIEQHPSRTVVLPEVANISVISDTPHSEGSLVPPEVTQRRIDRLRSIVQNGRKPYRFLDLSLYSPDPLGIKSFDEIILQGEAAGASSNRYGNLDFVDYSCAATPERIVKVQTGVEGAPVRGNSAHGVLFLRLGTQRGQLLDVAVKAFSRPSHAFVEYVNTQVIRGRGVDTLEPIAVIIEGNENLSSGNGRKSLPKSDEPIGFYMSAMEPIRSLDRLRVIRDGYMKILAGGETERQYLGYLSMIGATMAEMHLKGIFPKDSQIKNFAIRTDGSVIPIDFENTNIFNEDLYNTGPEKFVDWSIKGLEVLFRSLNGQGNPKINFFSGFSGDALWDAFDETIFSSYQAACEEMFLAAAGTQSIDADQFAQAIESLELIKQNLRAKIATPVANSSHQ